MVALIRLSSSSSPLRQRESRIRTIVVLRNVPENNRLPDRQLQVAGSDSLHLEILGGVAGQLEDLSSEVLQDGGGVHGGGGAHTTGRKAAALQVTVDPGKNI